MFSLYEDILCCRCYHGHVLHMLVSKKLQNKYIHMLFNMQALSMYLSSTKNQHQTERYVSQ